MRYYLDRLAVLFRHSCGDRGTLTQSSTRENSMGLATMMQQLKAAKPSKMSQTLKLRSRGN